MKKRFIIVVLDSVGIGAQPDAALFGDEGAHTLGNIYKKRGLNIPNLLVLGLGNIEASGLPRVSSPSGCFGRAAEITKAKDTTSGHWEMAGVIMDPPFRTYPNGFPGRVIDEFERRTGRGTLGNCVASGTEIIQRLGDEHVKTGKLIVYTSADSVFQIAAHQDVVPLEELYRCCEIARDMLTGDDLVGRVIARPFTGVSGAYTRTEFRRDYAIPPVGETILDALTARGMTTVCVGKIEDIFHKRGVTVSDHTRNNRDGIEATLNFIKKGTGDLIFTNLVDFDMLYGHRNDIEGYGAALEYFDAKLPALQAAMREGDVMLVTADHGCDPTTPSTDHSREYIPIVAFGPALRGGVNLGTRRSFADIGSTAFEYLTGESFKVGASFAPELK
jgi:phosphopentomutase